MWMWYGVVVSTLFTTLEDPSSISSPRPVFYSFFFIPFVGLHKKLRAEGVNSRPLCVMLVGCCEYECNQFLRYKTFSYLSTVLRSD